MQSIEKRDIKKEEDNGQPLLLILDDNQEIVTYLADELSGDYRCIYASNGREGLAVAYKKQPDLVIADLLMPEMDGMEFCKLLRKNQPTSTIPVIMLTAKDDKATELKSIKAGIDALISKPFDVQIITYRINDNLCATRKRLALKIQ